MSDEVKVTFRLSSPYASRLQRDSAANGMSPGQYARFLLISHFENEDVLEMRDELSEVHAELRRFRKDFDAALDRSGSS